MHAYLILDGATTEQSMRLIYELCSEPRCKQLYAGTFFESLLDQSPVLIDISSCDRIAQWYAFASKEKKIGTVFYSSQSVTSVFNHLQTLLEAKHPHGKMMLFRFYQPDFLWCILNAFTPGRLAAFLGPVASLGLNRHDIHGQNTWYLYNREIDPDANLPHRTLPDSPLWDFSEDEWQALQDAIMEYVVLPEIIQDVWINSYIIGLEGMNEEQVTSTVRDLMNTGRRLGMSASVDLSLFVDFELGLMPGLHNHPVAVKYIREQTAAGKNPMLTLSMDLIDYFHELHIPMPEAWPLQYEMRSKRTGKNLDDIYPAR